MVLRITHVWEPLWLAPGQLANNCFLPPLRKGGHSSGSVPHFRESDTLPHLITVFLPRNGQPACLLLARVHRNAVLFLSQLISRWLSLLTFYLLFLCLEQRECAKPWIYRDIFKEFQKRHPHSHLGSVTTTLPYSSYTIWLDDQKMSRIHKPHTFHHVAILDKQFDTPQPQLIHL